MGSSVERARDEGEDEGEEVREEISSRRPTEPADVPVDPWSATVPLQQRTAEIATTASQPAAQTTNGHRPPPDDPWLQPGADPWIDVTPGVTTDDPAAAAVVARRRRVGSGIALFAGGAVVGALLVSGYAGWRSNSSATALSGQNGTAQNGSVLPGAPGADGQSQPGLGGQDGQGFGGPPAFGGSAGEQRVYGTVTGVSSSELSVKSSSGTATYTIASDTQIIRDGRLASPSDLRVGDAVLVHVFPATNSDGVLERIIARSSSSSSSSSSDSSSEDDSTT